MSPHVSSSSRRGRIRGVVTALALALAGGPLVMTAPAGGAARPAPLDGSPASGPDTAGAQPTPVEHTGTLANGTTWRAVVPAGWNGTLLLYGHGYVPSFVPGPPVAQIAPNAGTEEALLARGYALAGSSYARNGWAMGTATRQDQLGALEAATGAIGRPPDRVLAYGTSMGGLVTGQLAEVAGDQIDGALATCGLMGGGVGLVNYQLDGAHAIDELLAPDAEIPLVGYDSLAEATAAAGSLTAAVDAGQQTPQGRARVALAAALFHLPDQVDGEPPPGPEDWEARQRAQHQWLRQTLSFVTAGRFDIETVAGGNPSANAGVDYRALFQHSADRQLVAAVYRAAGLDLDADLDRLTATADIAADVPARNWLRITSSLPGNLAVPVLSLHTTRDNLAPVQYQEDYDEEVRRAGRAPLLRQAYVDRSGHCAFTPAELVAALHALEARVASGQWADVAHWQHLNAAAEALDLGDAAYVQFQPGEFLGDRQVECEGLPTPS